MAAAAAVGAKDIKEFVDTRRAEKKAAQAVADAKVKADAAEAKANDDAASIATRTANEDLAKDFRAEADLANARRATIVGQRCLDVAVASPDVPLKCPAEYSVALAPLRLGERRQCGLQRAHRGIVRHVEVDWRH